MNTMRTSITTSVIAAVTLLAASTGSADMISGLEVHYQFENSANLGQNSAGVDGIGWG